jgi:5-carboxymethyl-2-hydroxymuconate isomerase
MKESLLMGILNAKKHSKSIWTKYSLRLSAETLDNSKKTVISSFSRRMINSMITFKILKNRTAESKKALGMSMFRNLRNSVSHISTI